RPGVAVPYDLRQWAVLDDLTDLAPGREAGRREPLPGRLRPLLVGQVELPVALGHTGDQAVALHVEQTAQAAVLPGGLNPGVAPPKNLGEVAVLHDLGGLAPRLKTVRAKHLADGLRAILIGQRELIAALRDGRDPAVVLYEPFAAQHGRRR